MADATVVITTAAEEFEAGTTNELLMGLAAHHRGAANRLESAARVLKGSGGVTCRVRGTSVHLTGEAGLMAGLVRRGLASGDE